jgi:CO/xanthine dehydrogenase Mo-binding subunit
VDYFQLLGAPGMEALDGDRYRVDELKRVVAQGRKNGDDFGAVIAISEMRKRLAGAKATTQDGSDIMGSTRIKYAAEATLLMSHATDAEIVKTCSATDKYPTKAKELANAAAKHRRTLSEAGQSIITVALDKGRDGTRRGTWHETFNFNTYTFGECVVKVNVPVPGAAKVKLVS